MFNLLPENLKSLINSEYKMRRLVLTLFFGVLIELSLLIFLFPTWLVSSYKEKEVVKQAEEMSQFLKNSNINPATGIIKGINSKLSVINSTLDYPEFIPFINKIIGQKTASVSITQFSYEVTSTSTASLSIAGVSKTRESLVSFVKKLEETKAFEKVDLPISNLAKDKNIEFTINLLISQ